MTEHTALFFIKGLHDHLRVSVAHKGEWCWPTRELVTENLKLNRAVLGADAVTSFKSQLGALRRKRWVVLEGCVSHCHAAHVKLTSTGLAALELMNEDGCSVHQARGRKSECRAGAAVKFDRKAA